MGGVKILFLCALFGAESRAHLLPQALEDVHRYVQKELIKRSHGAPRGGPPPPPPPPPPGQGIPAFTSTETFIGTPVIIQKEIRMDDKGGFVMPGFPIHGDINAAEAAASQPVPQIVSPPSPLPTGLMPPVPLKLNHGDQQVQASTLGQPAVIPANLVGPSTFVGNAPQNYQRPQAPPPPPPPPPQQHYQQPSASHQQQQYQPPPQQPQYQPPQQQQQYQPPPQQQQYQQPPPPQYQQPQQPQNPQGDQKTMQGWLPLDNDGSRLAKAVGVKVQVDDDIRGPIVQHQPQQQQRQQPQQQLPQKPPQPQENYRQPDYKDTGYSIRDQPEEEVEENTEGREVKNELLEIIPTNSLKLGPTRQDDIIVGIVKPERHQPRQRQQIQRSPVYPRKEQREGQSPKVVIHAQNVIIRGGPDGGIEEIQANNDSIPFPQGNPSVKQYQAYQGVPQLNNFLRDQLRFAAMNQLLQSAMEQSHPLSDKPFPRPLSLREIAQAVRNGEFPQPTREQLNAGGGGGGGLLDPLTPEPSMLTPTELQINIPHMVKMSPQAQLQNFQDPLTLPSIQTQNKVLLPLAGGGGAGLGSLYKNILQQELSGAGAFDPRGPLEYTLLAALSGGEAKVPQAPLFKQHKPGSTGDYGEMVKYTTGEDSKSKDSEKSPIQVVEARPTLVDLMKAHQQAHSIAQTGSLKDMSEQLLQQLLIQELQEVEGEEGQQQQQQQQQLQQAQLLLPVGLGPQAASIHRPLRTLSRPGFGTIAHPFAYLATEGVAAGGDETPVIYDETIEYTLPPGANVDDYIHGDGHHLHGLKKRPGHKSPYSHGPPPGLHGHHDDHDEEHDDADLMPVTKDTLVHLGKGALNGALSAALEFSRHHNPLTFIQRVRSLPPVKVDLYKVPVRVPFEKFPLKITGGHNDDRPPPHHHHHHSHHHEEHHHEGPPPRHHGHGRRGRKKHLPRKSNKYY